MIVLYEEVVETDDSSMMVSGGPWQCSTQALTVVSDGEDFTWDHRSQHEIPAVSQNWRVLHHTPSYPIALLRLIYTCLQSKLLVMSEDFICQ